MTDTNEQIALEDLVIPTLAGIEKVSTETFIHMAQRMILITGKLHTLTSIAFMTGQPGLELSNPAALTIPAEIPPEETEKIKDVLPKAAEIMAQVRRDMETAVQRLTIKDNVVYLPDQESGPMARQFQQALLDETLYLMDAGSESELDANLALVLKGVGIILKDHADEPEAVNIPLKVISRLPDRCNEILEALKPICSEEQWAGLQ